MGRAGEKVAKREDPEGNLNARKGKRGKGEVEVLPGAPLPTTTMSTTSQLPDLATALTSASVTRPPLGQAAVARRAASATAASLIPTRNAGKGLSR